MGSRSRLRAALVVAVALLAQVGGVAAIPAPVSAVTVAAGFAEQTVLTGLTHPTVVQFASDGRVFVAEKSGIIKVFPSVTTSSPAVFADLRTQVYNFWDRGLLGMTLAPNFPADPSVYVLYTYDHMLGDPNPAPRWGTPGATADGCPNPPGATSDGCVASARISRLTDVGGVAGPEQVLVEDWCQQYPSHSVGSLVFGADGSLYASAGDAASFLFTDWGQGGSPTNPCGDPPGGVGAVPSPPTAEGGSLRAQDLRTMTDPVTLAGSVIRIDPGTGRGAAGNPLAGHTDPNAARIVAHGFRNPVRFTVRPGTSEVWIGDVGTTRAEEINRIADPLGVVENFGWPCYEGSARVSAFDNAELNLCENLYRAGPAAHTVPLYSYGRNEPVTPDDGCLVGNASISGLQFYPSSGPYGATFAKALFFADHSRGCIWVMRAGANGLPDPATRSLFVRADNPVDLKLGPDGRLYYVNFDGGAVVRIDKVEPNSPPTAVLDASPRTGPLPLTIAFNGGRSSDPNGDALTYEWDLDGDGSHDDSTASAPSWTYHTAGAVTVRLRVTDPSGGTGTASAVVTPGNSAPATWIEMGSSAAWAVGDTIAFKGHAEDAQDGTMPASALMWELLIRHCPSSTCHSHVYRTWEGVDTGSFSAPDHEYPSHLTLRLTARDSDGESTRTSVDLQPRTLHLAFRTTPIGLPLTVGGITSTAPFSRRVIVGSANPVSATRATVDGGAYAFRSWSDGGAASHVIVAPASPTAYTARFAAEADHTPPVVTAPEARLRPAAVNVDAPIDVVWSARDVVSGLSATELQRSVDATPWQRVTLATPMAISARTAIGMHGKVQFRVRARDGAGNWSGWVYGPVLRSRMYDESYTNIGWSGTWRLQTSSAWYGGAARTTRTAGATATFMFRGRSVAWVARTGPDRGLTRVFVDGQYVSTVSLTSSVPGYRAVRFWRSWATAGAHTVRLYNLGRSEAPASEVDGFIVIN